MTERSIKNREATVGADKAYDIDEFVSDLEQLGIRAHAARLRKVDSFRDAYGRGSRATRRMQCPRSLARRGSIVTFHDGARG